MRRALLALAVLLVLPASTEAAPPWSAPRDVSGPFTFVDGLWTGFGLIGWRSEDGEAGAPAGRAGDPVFFGDGRAARATVGPTAPPRLRVAIPVGRALPHRRGRSTRIRGSRRLRWPPTPAVTSRSPGSRTAAPPTTASTWRCAAPATASARRSGSPPGACAACRLRSARAATCSSPGTRAGRSAHASGATATASAAWRRCAPTRRSSRSCAPRSRAPAARTWHGPRSSSARVASAGRASPRSRSRPAGAARFRRAQRLERSAPTGAVGSLDLSLTGGGNALVAWASDRVRAAATGADGRFGAPRDLSNTPLDDDLTPPATPSTSPARARDLDGGRPARPGLIRTFGPPEDVGPGAMSRAASRPHDRLAGPRTRRGPCAGGDARGVDTPHGQPRSRPPPVRRLHPRGRRGSPRLPRGARRHLARARRVVLARPLRAPGQHRALHRRRPGPARDRRPAAGRRRARPGRVLRADGDRRGHARRLLQPRHEAAARRGRREDDDHGRPDAARAGVPVRERARGAGVRRVARRALRRDPRGRRVDDEVGPPAGHRAVLGQPHPLHALQLHDRRRRRPEHDRQGHAGRLPLDPRAVPRHRPVLPRGQLRHRQEELADQHAAHPRQARGGRGDDPRLPSSRRS